MPKYMVEILSDLDNKNGAEILARLADDEDLYEEICTLSERRMTKRLDRMSEELKDKNKVPPKEKRFFLIRLSLLMMARIIVEMSCQRILLLIWKSSLGLEIFRQKLTERAN